MHEMPGLVILEGQALGCIILNHNYTSTCITGTIVLAHFCMYVGIPEFITMCFCYVLPVNPQDSPDIPERLAPSDSELQSEALAKPGPSNGSNVVANGNPRTATPAPDKLKPRKRGSETPTAVSRKEFSVTPYNWQ